MCVYVAAVRVCCFSVFVSEYVPVALHLCVACLVCVYVSVCLVYA